MKTFFTQPLWLLLLCWSCIAVQEEQVMELPDSLPQFSVVHGDVDVFDGYIFLRQIVAPGGQLMINSKGEIKWFQVSDSTLYRPFTPYEDSYVALRSDSEIHEITYYGDTISALKYGRDGFDRKLHHELIKNRKGNYVALTREMIKLDLTAQGGAKEDTVLTDGIIVLAPNGEKLWHWSLDQVLDPLRYEGIVQVKKDWGHANALYEDIDGHYLVSWRDFNAIWKINSSTGEVMWSIDNTSTENELERFYKQHGVHRNKEGDVLLFDNGDRRKRATSRAYSFDQDGAIAFEVILPDSLFTFKQGSVYEVEEDKLLFSSTTTKTLVITDRQGELLWAATSDHAFYRAYYLDSEFLKLNRIR